MQGIGIVPGAPNTRRNVFDAVNPYFPQRNYLINGITKDETGAATDGFTVYLMNMGGAVPVVEQTTVSANGGLYSFVVGPGLIFWAVSYKSGSPDKAGATSNQLVGV